MKLVVNRTEHELPPDLVDPAMPLLWVLRDVLNLTGTKYACGIGACGACTVRLDGQAVRACVTPLSAAEGHKIQTIEDLGTLEAPHALQRAWLQHQVPQCGYCQSGLLMAAAALLSQYARPTDAQIEAQISHLCRCGSLARVRQAIHSAVTPERPSTSSSDTTSTVPAQVAAALPSAEPTPAPNSARSSLKRSVAKVRAAKVRAARRHDPQGTPR
jgi:isoquinoline 1-oxidoreductase alpha subunit